MFLAHIFLSSNWSAANVAESSGNARIMPFAEKTGKYRITRPIFLLLFIKICGINDTPTRSRRIDLDTVPRSFFAEIHEMQSWFTFELDGEICRVEHESTRLTLARFLGELDPLYSHYPDGDPWQGGSPVIIAENSGDAPRFRTVDANLILLPMVADSLVWTPEGISNLDPDHPAVAVLDLDNMECGEERRMFVLALFFEGFYRADLRRTGQMNEQFDALVSRTADVRTIKDAGRKLFASAEHRRHEVSQQVADPARRHEVWTGRRDIFNDRFSKKLFRKNDRDVLDYVDRRKHRFHRPKTISDLQRLLAHYPEAKLIAGGTWLGQFAEEDDWESLISIDAVDELQMISTNHEYWEIGAGVNLTRIGEEIGGECPAFLKALTKFGSRSVRNRASLGGYLAVASDTGQLAPLLIALDARVILLSPDGERDAPISHFYSGKGRTILREGEIVRSVIIPRANQTALANRGMTSRICDIYTVGPRRSLCEPFVTGAFALELRETIVAKAWIAYTGVGDVPVRARKAEEAISGKPWDEDTVVGALNPLFQEIQVTKEDFGQANSAYRKQLVMTLFQKFFCQHPTPQSVKPAEQGVAREFSLQDQPFFDTVS